MGGGDEVKKLKRKNQLIKKICFLIIFFLTSPMFFALFTYLSVKLYQMVRGLIDHKSIILFHL